MAKKPIQQVDDASAASRLKTQLDRIGADVGRLAAAAELGAKGLERDAVRATEAREVETLLLGRLAAVESSLHSQHTSLVDTLASATAVRAEEAERRVEAVRVALDQHSNAVASLVETISPAALDERIHQSATTVGEAVVSRLVTPRLEELDGMYEQADERLEQLRAFVDTFGPGGLPVLQNENEQLRATLERQTADLETECQRNRDLLTKIAELEAQRLVREVAESVSPEELSRRLAELHEQSEGLPARKALESRLGKAELERDELRVEVEDWQRKELDHRRNMEAAREMERLRLQLSEAEQERDETNAYRRRLERNLQLIHQHSSNLQSQLDELSAVQSTEEERKQRIEQLTESNAEHQRVALGLRSANDELAQQCRSLDLQVRELQTAASTSEQRWRTEQAAATAATLKESKDDLGKWADAEVERRAAAVLAERDRLAQAEAQLTGEVRQAQLQFVELQQQLNQEAARVDTLAAELAHEKESQTRLAQQLEQHASAHIERLATSLREDAQADRLRIVASAEADKARVDRDCEAAAAVLDARRHDLQLLQGELSLLEGKKGGLAAELAVLEGRIDELRVHAVPDEERLGSLRNPVFAEADLSDTTAPDESEWLGSLQRSIVDAGFVFSKRLLFAFHTSLKIAHHNPLTVLAGISGTGKSELPRLYAELGGVPFLSLPVQPNWDSPHDLFGFFNYTDGRLKAEPLSRLLAQVNDEKSRLRDSPVIVLLDEMNLARVEYYFAELLSKLESRRSAVGSDSAAAHRRASVEVDAGPGQDSIPLFLDPRVLFVGTMNEDESTLTLSDKVLDRSCVLHFPAPQEMSLSPQGAASSATRRLAWQTWSSWRSEANDSEIAGKLNSINRVLDPIDRPFGHRLFRGIHAYIANYPGGQNLDEAWADQFSMKLMPRLQGLENTESKVRTALDDLASHVPDELKDAFDAARDREYFTWRPAMDAYRAEQ